MLEETEGYTLPPGTLPDGEVVVLQNGKPSFGLLLACNQDRAPFKIRSLARTLPVAYVDFDLLYSPRVAETTLLTNPAWLI